MSKSGFTVSCTASQDRYEEDSWHHHSLVPGERDFMPERIFDLQEAESLLPQLEGWLRTAIEGKKKLEEIELQYSELVQRISESGGLHVDIVRSIYSKQERGETIARLRSALEEIEDSGCLLKDLEIGLVDFPCEVDGREIYLCWKLDEPCIGYWHDPQEGFSGRKPINADFPGQTGHSRPN